MLSLCQHGYESLLERELGAAGLTVLEKGPGWARADLLVDDPVRQSLADMAFPQLTLMAPRELKGESVNALAAQLAAYFFESLRGERIVALRLADGARGRRARPARERRGEGL